MEETHVIEVHGFTPGEHGELGVIDATIDGQRWNVPDVPSNRHRQMIAEWEAEGNTIPAYVSPIPTHEQQVLAIKAEARRRILIIMNEDKQRNTLAAGLEATMTYGADPANWPPDLQQRQAEAMAAWAEIERLRSRSDAIEMMEPIPADITDDGLWSWALEL